MFYWVSSKVIINLINVIIKYFFKVNICRWFVWEYKWSFVVLFGLRGENFYRVSCVWIWEFV